MISNADVAIQRQNLLHKAIYSHSFKSTAKYPTKVSFKHEKYPKFVYWKDFVKYRERSEKLRRLLTNGGLQCIKSTEEDKKETIVW